MILHLEVINKRINKVFRGSLSVTLLNVKCKQEHSSVPNKDGKCLTTPGKTLKKIQSNTLVGGTLCKNTPEG